jgi:hypothetical protein
MGEETGASGGNGKGPRGGQGVRRSGPKGFRRAGVLIEPQTRAAAARRGYAEARLKALWAEIAGPEAAALATPVKLTMARGPAGGLLTLAARPACGPQVQMMLPLIRERVNAALGPGTVGRVQITQGTGFAEPAAAFRPRAEPEPEVDLGEVKDTLSSIGDRDFRAALETLARNVLSRRGK